MIVVWKVSALMCGLQIKRQVIPIIVLLNKGVVFFMRSDSVSISDPDS